MLKIDRSLYVYKSTRGEQAELKLKIKDICQTRVRYGYRRVHVLLKRDGWPVNPKRIYRLYKEMDLQLRNKVPKRRVKAKLRADRTEPTHSNHVWAMDFPFADDDVGRRIGDCRGLAGRAVLDRGRASHPVDRRAGDALVAGAVVETGVSHRRIVILGLGQHAGIVRLAGGSRFVIGVLSQQRCHRRTRFRHLLADHPAEAVGPKIRGPFRRRVFRTNFR
ncbi:hypothetical protein FHT79_006083 [Rhizobium sp. BK212]|nr:hypothetical protein [Rhizobium sp. BK212]